MTTNFGTSEIVKFENWTNVLKQAFKGTSRNILAKESSSNASQGLSPAEQNSHSVRRSTAITVFNWDDTLFPVSDLHRQYGSNFENISNLDTTQFQSFEDAGLQAVLYALTYGSVAIITAAALNWVKMSAGCCLSRLAQCMQEKNIQIFSTYDCGGESEISGGMHNKETAFEKAVSYYCPENHHLHLIAVGDQAGDRDAARHIGLIRDNCWTKLISMIEYPSASILENELKWVQRNFGKIVSMECGIEFNYRAEREFVPVRRLEMAPSSSDAIDRQ